MKLSGQVTQHPDGAFLSHQLSIVSYAYANREHCIVTLYILLPNDTKALTIAD